MIKLKSLIFETVKRNDRTVLFTDKHGWEVVWTDNEYKICVDDSNNATNITLWYLDEIKWIKCGILNSRRVAKKFDNISGNFLSIVNINIDDFARGLGLASKMYKALINFSNKNIVGLVSYLPDRFNKKQILFIWKKFNPIVDGDYEYIIIE